MLDPAPVEPDRQPEANRSSGRTSFFTVALYAALVAAISGFLDDRVLHAKRAETAGEIGAAISEDLRLSEAMLRRSLLAAQREALLIDNFPVIRGLIKATAAGGVDPESGLSTDEWRGRVEQGAGIYLARDEHAAAIRVIGIADNGREVLSVTRGASGKATVAGADGLRQAGGRAEFRAALQMPPGEVILATVAPNTEDDGVEQPFGPLLRVSVPVRSAAGDVILVNELDLSLRVLLEPVVRLGTPGATAWVTDAAGQDLWPPRPGGAFDDDRDRAGHREFTDVPAASAVAPIKGLPEGTTQATLRAPDGAEWLTFTRVLGAPEVGAIMGGIVLHAGIPTKAIAAQAGRSMGGTRLLLWMTSILTAGWLASRARAPVDGTTRGAKWGIPIAPVRVPAWRAAVFALLPVPWGVAVLLAFGTPVLDPFMVMLPAALAASWWGGFRAGLVATALAGIGAWGLRTAPPFLSRGDGGGDFASIVSLGGLVVAGLVTSAWRQSFRQRQAERRAADERAAWTTRAVRVGYWEIDLLAGRSYWSTEILENRGIYGAGIVGTFAAIEKFTHPEDLERVRAVFQAAPPGGSVHLESRIVRSDGQVRWVESRGQATAFIDGRAVRFVGTEIDITERKTAEMALFERAAQLSAALQLAGAGTWSYDVATAECGLDDDLFRIFGTTAAAEGGYRMSGTEYLRRFFLPEDADAVAKESAAAFVAPGPDFQGAFETRFVRSGGEVGWLAVRFARVVDTTGSVVRLFGVNQDISAQKRDEAKLRASAEFQRAIFENAGAAMVTTTLQGSITAANPETEVLTGYAPEDLLGGATPAIFHDPAELTSRIALQPVPRKESFADPGFAALVTPLHEARVLAMGRTVLDGQRRAKRASDTREWSYVRKDGQRRTVLLTVSMFMDGSGEHSGYLLVARDLSARKAAENALAEALDRLEERVAERTRELDSARQAADAANRAKSDFLATMSHEIRTPMNGVLGLTELLLRTPLDAKQRDLAAGVASSGRALLGLINDVLDLSRIEAGRMRLDESPLDIRALVAGVAATVRAGIGNKPVSVEIEVSPGVPPTVLGDEGRLRQILLNLVGNGAKFTPEGKVTIRVDWAPVTGAPRLGRLPLVGNVPRWVAAVYPEARTEDSVTPWLRLEVADSGPGVPAEFRPRLFEAFEQGDGTSTRAHEGTGLGLAVVRELVGLMGGRVGLRDSQEPGATFWVDLPLRATKPTRVLLVENAPVAARLAGLAIERAGASVVTVAGQRDAEDALRAGGFDTVVFNPASAVFPALRVLAPSARWVALGSRTPELADAGVDAVISRALRPDEVARAMGPAPVPMDPGGAPAAPGR